MKDTLITILRDKNTPRASFRKAADALSSILAAETGEHLSKATISVETPLAQTEGVRLAHHIVFVPILRSGIAMVPAFYTYFPDAKVGFVGMKRDEKTAIAASYYENLPEIGKDDQVLVLDPMIATGGSGVATLKKLVDAGVPQEKIVFVALISAPEGVGLIEESFPQITLIIAQRDSGLNEEKFIIPGIGDFGDRYFGTE